MLCRGVPWPGAGGGDRLADCLPWRSGAADCLGHCLRLAGSQRASNGAAEGNRRDAQRPGAGAADWVLALFYFLTFGGFVAFSIYLPSLLKDQFALRPADAGFRTARFVVLATLCRPLGRWLSDRIGGARVLFGVFLGIVPLALLLTWPLMLPFTVGALGCAALLGVGNGAVFKLVPQYFPKEVGTVTGLVGAMGGVGGFSFPSSWDSFGTARERCGPDLFC